MNDFFSRKSFVAKYVSFVRRCDSDGKTYVSVIPVDNNEVKVDERNPVTRFLFTSNHHERLEKNPFYTLNGDTLYLFDSDEIILDYALKRLKYSLSDEESLHWMRLLKSLYNSDQILQGLARQRGDVDDRFIKRMV